jgi:predicted porin
MGSIASPAWGEGAGPGCCEDLENVVMALGAAPARKDSPNGMLRLYGQLNKAILFWDDGRNSAAYGVDNETSSSRLGLVGKHKFPGAVTAGFRVEIDTRWTLSSEVSSGEPAGDLSEGTIRLRHAHWFVEDDKLGRLTFGQQSPATDDITIINLGSQMSDAALHYNNSFALRIPSPGTFRLTWGDLAHTVDTMRGLFARYDTPTLSGFLFSVAAGEDQIWDAALRYSLTWDALRLAAGIGYMQNDTLDFRDVRGSASALHIPSGLFLSLAGGVRHDDGVAIDADGRGHFYFAQAGLTRNIVSFGATTIYGEIGQYDDFSVGRVFTANLTGLADRRWALTSTGVDRWGFGIEQAVDAHKLLLYAQFHHYEATFSGARCTELAGTACTLDGTRKDFAPAPWQAVVVGARIQF